MLDEICSETWLVSDTHFYHYNINKYEPSRLENMKSDGFDNPDEWVFWKWNSVVGIDDLVLHLGDFTTKKGMNDFDIFSRLNGRIVLILGNHDMQMLNKLEAYAAQHPHKLQIIKGFNGVFKPQGLSVFIKEINGVKVLFSHYPGVSQDKFARSAAKRSHERTREIFGEQNCDLAIHGHLHSNDGFTDKSREINVSIERTGFQPVQIGSLVNKFVN
jgi:calcineurin-like phosphoesterase family protein